MTIRQALGQLRHGSCLLLSAAGDTSHSSGPLAPPPLLPLPPLPPLSFLLPLLPPFLLPLSFPSPPSLPFRYPSSPSSLTPYPPFRAGKDRILPKHMFLERALSSPSGVDAPVASIVKGIEPCPTVDHLEPLSS
eukprot:3568673-Rhodomonas_salina.1